MIGYTKSVFRYHKLVACSVNSETNTVDPRAEYRPIARPSYVNMIARYD